MKKKIVIASEEEIARYGGGAASPEGRSGGEESRRPTESGTAAGGPPAEPAALAGAEAPATPPETQAGGAVEPSETQEDWREWKDRCLRARAELANYRRRVEKEKEECLRYAAAGLIRGLLGVLDNLDRVIQSAAEHPENVAAIVDGVKLTRESFMKVLAEHQVTEIPAVGQPFDPAVHEAMMQRVSDEHPDQTVLEELSRGYRLHDRVLRPARVVVSRRSEGSTVEESPKADATGQE